MVYLTVYALFTNVAAGWKRKDIGNVNRKHYIALSGERVFKGAVDV
jgi:hypothetical protein